MTDYSRAVETPETVARLAEILRTQWDPDGVVRDGMHAGSEFHREQAVTIAGMLAADARDLEVQRYLRQIEQKALPTTLHPIEARHAIAAALWRAARGA